MTGAVALRTFATSLISLLLCLPMYGQSMFGAANSPIAGYIASDNCTRANENPLVQGGLEATTASAQGAMQITSNACTNVPTGGGTNQGGYTQWVGNTFATAQFCEVIIKAMGATANNADIGCHPRVQDAANFTGCEMLQSTGSALPSTQQVYLTNVAAGAETPQAVQNITVTAGNKIRCELRSNTVVYRVCADRFSPCYGKAVGKSSISAADQPELHVWGFVATNLDQATAWDAGNLDPAVIATQSDAISSTLSTNTWATVASSFSVSSGAQKGGSAAGVSAAIYIPAPPYEFTGQQCAQTTIKVLNGLTDGIGPTINMTGSSVAAGVGTTFGAEMYAMDVQSTTASIFYVKVPPSLSNTFTTLSTTSVTTSVNDTWKLCNDGSGHLTASHNGTHVAALDVTNTTLPGGYPGIFQFGNVATQNTFVATVN